MRKPVRDHDMLVISLLISLVLIASCHTSTPATTSEKVNPTPTTTPPRSIETPQTTPSPTRTPTARPSSTPTPTVTPGVTPTPWVYPTSDVTQQPAFELGGHVRDLALPYRDQMHYAGMTWLKAQISYGKEPDGIVHAGQAHGLKTQLTAQGSPGLVTQPGFEADYAAWVATLATAGVDAIEIWNEPNIDREWPTGHISPEAYTRLLCAAYDAIKAANPDTAVISAAPAPTGWFLGCSPNGCDDQPWMEGLYAAGAADCMDYIGAHHNAGATSPAARIGHPADPSNTHHSWYFLPQTEIYFDIFKGTHQLFYTEMGYASQEGVPRFDDQFAWAREIDNAEQAAWLAESVQLSLDTGMVGAIMIWNVDFNRRYGSDPQDGFAIVRANGYCPACEALHAVLYPEAP